MIAPSSREAEGKSPRQREGDMHLHAHQSTEGLPSEADMRLARNAGARLRALLDIGEGEPRRHGAGAGKRASSKAVSSKAGRAREAPAGGGQPLRFKVLHPRGAGHAKATTAGETVEIPSSAAALLLHLLGHIADGVAVTIIPVQREFTTQQAADLLGVSRPFVVKEIEEKRLPARKVGTRRRVMYGDLMKYKARSDAERQKALDGLAALDQELGLM